MKASANSLLKFLKEAPQVTIPIYQRTYSWEKDQCQQLWDDIVRVGKSDEIDAHFVGSVIYIEKGLYNVSDQSPLLVIDGQQRLTTVSLILEALARKLESSSEPVEGFSDEKIRKRYLFIDLEEGEKKYKLLLTQTDKETLIALLDRRPSTADPSPRVRDNFKFFESQIAKLDDLKPLCLGLAKLMIVDVSLTKGQDNPQLIFESMNSTGKELSKADLIRNFVLMGLEPKDQTRLYEDYWRPMEVEFGVSMNSLFDWFMRDYLTLKNKGVIPNVDAVYEVFKTYSRKKDVDELVADVHRFANYYCAMAFGKEQDSVLASAFEELHVLKYGVAYPLLLGLYDDYNRGDLSRDEFAQIIQLIVNYVFRRAVCNIPTNTLNKTFATFSKNIEKGRYLESVKAHLLSLDSSRRFPDDEEFSRDLREKEIYPRKRTLKYLLNHLENHNRKERVEVGEYTIEHIMPQTKNLSREWKTALGPEWEAVQQQWLHTLGNLTLTGYNSEYGNKSFSEKRDMEGGYSKSPLRLNEGIGELEEWNVEEIQRRAERLARLATTIWERPKLSREVLNTYYPEHKIDDHEYLAKQGITRQLFDAFSEQVQSLNPVITEEVLKWHIAYKLDYKDRTNFVNVAPQAKKLKLTLDIDFHELNDPEGMANDFADRNYWMPGNVGLDVKSEDEMPYAIGLVRQALEKQIGEPSNDGK